LTNKSFVPMKTIQQLLLTNKIKSFLDDKFNILEI